MGVLEPSHVQRALDIAFTEIVEKLERSKEPWLRGRSNGRSSSAFEPNGSPVLATRTGLLDMQPLGVT
jgi:hypothetical protein